jgi:hypothetical protein
MARKTARVVITDGKRDSGKTFVITEMAADKAERWGLRALLALTHAGVEVPEGAMQAGMAGIATVGLKMLGGLDYYAAEPLLAEMLDCVQIDMGNGVVRPLHQGDDGDIEEVKTYAKLRQACLELHVGFSMAALAPIMASVQTATTDA